MPQFADVRSTLLYRLLYFAPASATISALPFETRTRTSCCKGPMSTTPEGRKAVRGGRRRLLIQPGQQLQGLRVRLPEDLAALDEVIEVAPLHADLDRNQLQLSVQLGAYRPEPRRRPPVRAPIIEVGRFGLARRVREPAGHPQIVDRLDEPG